MRQLFYNIAVGIEHRIRREKRATISEFALSEILCKLGIGFISNFLLKVRVLYSAILKRKNLSLPLKVETDQFAICLVLPECLSVKMCCISPSNSESNRDGADAESLFPSFFSFSASFKHSSPREIASSRRSVSQGAVQKTALPLAAFFIFYFFARCFLHCALSNWTPGRG